MWKVGWAPPTMSSDRFRVHLRPLVLVEVREAWLEEGLYVAFRKVEDTRGASGTALWTPEKVSVKLGSPVVQLGLDGVGEKSSQWMM